MTSLDYVQGQLDAHRAVLEATAALAPTLVEAGALIAERIAAGNTLLLCGNGGSAADAQHVAAELVGRFLRERRGYAAIALTTDSSALTSIGNDFGYDQVFRRQVEALAREGDVLLAISTSGNSPNVLLAVKEAKARGCQVIGWAGRGGGALAELCDVALVVPSDDTQRIQEMHGMFGHVICGLVERALMDA